MRNIVGICLTALAFSTAMNCHAAPVEIGSLAGMRTAKSTIELAGMNTEVRSVALGARRQHPEAGLCNCLVFAFARLCAAIEMGAFGVNDAAHGQVEASMVVSQAG